MKYLGFANGWDESNLPELYKEAKERELPIHTIYEGSGVTRCECPELDFYYYIDSTD